MYDATDYPDWTLADFVNAHRMAPEYRPDPGRYKLMQFTGLRDRNGREIYEGDVVEAKSWHPMRYQVEFIEGGFCFTNKRALSASPIDINMMFSSQGCACSVIGTIHENPELIPA